MTKIFRALLWAFFSLFSVLCLAETNPSQQAQYLSSPGIEIDTSHKHIATSSSKNRGHTAAWSNLTPKTDGIVAKQFKVTGNLSKLPLTEKSNFNEGIDGILANAEHISSVQKTQLLEALDAGLVVVLDSSGSEKGRILVEQLSLDLANLGVRTDAVMLYKGGADQEVGIFPFGAGKKEREELVALMKRVGRRR